MVSTRTAASMPTATDRRRRGGGSGRYPYRIGTITNPGGGPARGRATIVGATPMVGGCEAAGVAAGGVDWASGVAAGAAAGGGGSATASGGTLARPWADGDPAVGTRAV